MWYVLLALLTPPVHAKLGPAMVKESALKHHPTVLAALEGMRAGEEAARGAKGAFDAKVTSDYRRQTKDEHNETMSRTFLQKPLGFANSKVYAGLEQVSGAGGGIFSPFHNTSNPSSQYGNYTVLGATASLWKNFTTDPNRAGLKNARLDAQMAKGEKKLTEWDIGRFGQSAYWEWVTALRVKNIFEELLKNGEVRNEYLSTRHKKGDSAQILVTENEQYVASRKGALMAAKERLIRAEYALSLFYRDGNGEPLVPPANEEFEDYPAQLSVLLEKVDLNSNVDELLKDRPDIKNLSLTVEKSQVDLELAKQDLRPQVDVLTEYYQRSEVHPQGLPRDYLMVMAQVSIPIEWNLGAGNIAAAKARQNVARSRMNLGVQSYKFEVQAMRQALGLQLEQVAQSEIEFSRAKELVEAETYKFRSGGGNLFLVNLREQAKAHAEASFHESRLAFMNTLLGYQALVRTQE